VTARNATGRVDTLERDGWPNACPTQEPAGHLVPLTPAGDRIAGQLLTEQRAALAELLAELPEADQRHLLQASASLRAVLARHPGL
jgi:DNA-binding MarR family transcriptional regulator